MQRQECCEKKEPQRDQCNWSGVSKGKTNSERQLGVRSHTTLQTILRILDNTLRVNDLTSVFKGSLSVL
jgi:hypothetical protein